MKKQVFLVWIALCSFGALQAQISLEEAFKLLQEKELITNEYEQWVYAAERPLKQGEEIKAFNQVVRGPKQASWFFFLDDNPYANWQHPCRYVFVGVETGELQLVKGSTPPDWIHEMKVLRKKTKTPERVLKFIKENNIACGTASNKYAVIISGGWSQGANHIRYWNDCSFVYSTLINKYGYDENNIFVLMSDGLNTAVDISNGTNSNPDLDGDGDNDIQFSATHANITSVFNTLGATLNDEDELFIFTTDHGGVDNAGSSAWDTLLYLWGETITDDEFAVEVDKVNAGKISIVMEQCNSGGFIDDLSAPNRVIATAAKHTELSWAGPTINTDEFVYYWTSAVNEALPNGTAVVSDSNGDTVVSMREAFLYAETNDSQNETPQYDENPTNLGEQLTLNGTGDLYIRDNATPNHPVTDTGVEPNAFTGPMWTSPDIWVRQNMDNGTTHQNPEYKNTSPNGVYIRVKNRGCAPITDAKIRLYYSKASTGLSWPLHWVNFYDWANGNYILHGDEITSVPVDIPDVMPNGEVIVEIPWYPPKPSNFESDIHHFCLVARVISQIDPIGTEGSSVNWNTKQNNNIAWKNVSVHDTNPSNNISTSVFVRNIHKQEALINLRLFDGGFANKKRALFLEHGTIQMTMSPELFERWKGNGFAEGVEVVNENTVQFLKPEAVLGRIPLKPEERFELKLAFKLKNTDMAKYPFLVDIIQEGKEGFEGGERFALTYEETKKQETDDQVQIGQGVKGVYPNPASEYLIANYYLLKSEYVRVTAQSLFSRRSTTLYSGKSSKGQHQKRLGLKHLAKGHYIVTITAGDSVISKQRIVKE
ncbi:conserved exported hypothetical protein [Tenacibaculum litopenaei]|jgi:hypothetical protein|uniref:C13 family peptidase n=1 Tax=Tenacibaculum litopenaei TaxID=396016 RepID=UPI0038938A1A